MYVRDNIEIITYENFFSKQKLTTYAYIISNIFTYMYLSHFLHGYRYVYVLALRVFN